MPIGRLRGEFEGASVFSEAQRFQAPDEGILSLGKSINRVAGAAATIALIRAKGRLLFLVPESGAASFVISLRPGDYTAARTFTVADQGLNTVTATAHGLSSMSARAASSPSSSASSPTPAIRARRSPPPSPRPAAGRSRSSSEPNGIASSSSPSAGSSSAPSPGSAATAAWRAISNATPAPSPPSSVSP